MQAILKVLLAILGNSVVQQLILLGLSEAAKRSDNTIDDKVVQIVENGYRNRVNPIQRAVEGS